MPRPIALRIVLKTLEAQGFVLISQKGSHAKFRKRDKKKYTVIVKMSKKQIPHGTFQAILKQSGLSEDDFRKK